jgi:hypothetical protein
MFQEKKNVEKQKPVVVLFAEYNLKIKNSLNVKVQQLWYGNSSVTRVF